MTVRRIVANLATGKPTEVARFYRELFDLAVVMDHGWLLTLASDASALVQLSLASEGGAARPCRICPSRSITSCRSMNVRSPPGTRSSTH